LLIPGLVSLVQSGEAEAPLLIGSGLDDWSEDEWRERVRGSAAAEHLDGSVAERIADTALYEQADVTSPEQLRRVLGKVEGRLVIYFALPPKIAIRSCEALKEIGCPEGTRLALEKPFGHDAESAAAFNEMLVEIVPERQIHRVDHFLGLSTVLNLVGLRFANRVFEPVLNNHHVKSVDIVWDEDLALEGRAGYYDHAGAMIDMIQSHLLQVTAILAMEPPPAISPEDVRDGTERILRAASIRNGDPVKHSRRARYTAGDIEGRRVPSYADEDGVDPELRTETLAEIELDIKTWRWAGVPFRLRSGKALGNPRKEATITFRDAEQVPAGLEGAGRPNRLRIGLGFGADTLRFDIAVNGPGDPWELDPATMEAQLGAGNLNEYGEVLKGVLEGDPTLSVRGDAAVECWRIIEPVREAWKKDQVPLDQYVAGSSGPEGWPS